MTVQNLHLENERGESMASVSVANLEGAWPKSREGGFPLLQGLDPVGTTMFNRLQAFGVEEELSRLRSTLADAGQRATLEQLIELTRRCQRGGRLYLRFVGKADD